MKKNRKILTVVLALTLIVSTVFSVTTILSCKKRSSQKQERLYFSEIDGKVKQINKTLGYTERNIPTTLSSEGLNSRYPTYGTSLADITDEEKDNLLEETSLMLASSSTYDSLDADGNYYLNGEPTGKKLYKHESAVGMYYGDVDDNERAVVEQITLCADEVRNYVTGLYAPAGEIVKIEISQEDLDAIGGELLVVVGQVSHRNNINNIWKARNDFSRMPIIANKLTVTSTTAYVGNPLGGPIYIYPSAFGKTFTVTVSGAVKYAHFIYGQTTREEVEQMKSYSAPYYDYEVWDLGVRLSGPSKYGNYDYENLVQVGELWEKIVRTSRQVPCSANATISVGYVFDCFVAAGAACAFQGGHSWVNAPCSWLSGATNYQSMVTDGFWGIIHEYNHLYQSYGMESGKTNEVTNNATSLLSYLSYTKISEKRSLNDGTLGDDWNRFTDASRSLRETLEGYEKGGVQQALNAYADLIHAFGTDVFTKATRMQAAYGVDGWYEALSLATNYNFTYYFEKILGQTLSQEKKDLYDGSERITFVPIATVFQTGRSHYEGNKEVFTQTMTPFVIDYGEKLQINFNENLILPSDFTFEIKSVSQPKNGKITKVSEGVYEYVPSGEEYSGEIKVVVGLASSSYSTRDVSLTLAFRQKHKNQVETFKYYYDGETSYSTVAEAVANDFAGYSKVEKNQKTSTFINGLANKQIGVVQGKIYIEKTGEYALCLRSGRGNNTLYISINDKNSLKQALSLDTNHVNWALTGEHVVTLELKEGDYVYFKEITLSRHAGDAFTELGIECLDDASPSMSTVKTGILYTFDGEKNDESFSSNAKYPRVYEIEEKLYTSSSSSHTAVSVNMGEWSSVEAFENIFDDDLNNYYHNERSNFVSEDNPFIMVADTGERGKYNNITITTRTSGQYNIPCTFKLYVSNDCEKWALAGEYVDLALNGNTVSANFDEREFRYYKLYVTDTKSVSSGNKYVTIAKIEFSYIFGGTELAPTALTYYSVGKKTFVKRVKLSSFGQVIEGDGKAEYVFSSDRFALVSCGDTPCKIKLSVNGKTHKIQCGVGRQVVFSEKFTSVKNKKIKIEVLSGKLCVDSVIV